jgi:hypothetical protein
MSLGACGKKEEVSQAPIELGPKWGFIDHTGKFVIKAAVPPSTCPSLMAWRQLTFRHAGDSLTTPASSLLNGSMKK